MQIAKNGSAVPVFQNGRTLFSAYNPERDAESFFSAHKEAFDTAGCILVGGIGNGLHLKILSEQYPEKQIIAFEADEVSLAFSKANLVCPLESVVMTEISQLNYILPANYLPALHGNFAFASIRSWSDNLKDRMDTILSMINGVISTISADYSVQAQFGKLWHRNILVNLKHYDAIQDKQTFDFNGFETGGRKAAIIGAGPSLDESILTLIEHRKEFCVFSTDTAFGTLKAAGITPDFIVTVDSQSISEQHFIGHNLKGTVLAADLTANSSIIRKAINQNCPLLLFHNNHPLSLLIDEWLSSVKHTESPFPSIDSGAGTVLHAAVDLSRKLDFQEQVFFGADFSYINGKPYTKGTYLEQQFFACEKRTANGETAYNKVMFRSPLISLSSDIYTTEVLKRYQKALESYLDNGYNQNKITIAPPHPVKMADFTSWYLEKLQKKDKKVLFSLLPLFAWYKKNFLNADTESVYAFAEQNTADVGRIQCHQRKK
ncbi:MAG: DUF115 domain-containing protein [Treponema sp.]|nr:DUF115 domain-containing protein [Candidatus Treponema caballi]